MLSPPAVINPVSPGTRRNLCLRVSPDNEAPPSGRMEAGPDAVGAGMDRIDRMPGPVASIEMR